MSYFLRLLLNSCLFFSAFVGRMILPDHYFENFIVGCLLRLHSKVEIGLEGDFNDGVRLKALKAVFLSLTSNNNQQIQE